MTSRDRFAPDEDSPAPSVNERGFTLVELVVVLVIFALLATSVVGRFDILSTWREREQFRTFLNTWEFLFRESTAKGESYRLVIDLDRNSYTAYREIPSPETNVKQVDYLKNMRLKSERERRANTESELLTRDDEFKLEDDLETLGLETLFYNFAYADPFGNVKLARLTDFPQLSESVNLPDGVRFKGVKTRAEVTQQGRAIIRFSPRGGSEFAVVYLQTKGEVTTISMNPTTGEVISRTGELDLDWDVERPSMVSR